MKRENVDEKVVCVSEYDVLRASRRITLQDVCDHVSGPTLSIVVHVLALAFLSTMIIIKVPEEGQQIEVLTMTVEVREIDEIPEVKQDEKPEPQDVDYEVEKPEVTLENPEVVVDDIPSNPVADTVISPDIPNVKITNSPLLMPALLKGRLGPDKAKALQDHGGGPLTEKMLRGGLIWLRDNQNADGSWGDSREEYKPALTAFALMAFLARGETTSSAIFGPTVYKAIRRLVDYVGPEADKVDGGYSHGIVIYALAEAYAMTSIPMLAEPVEKGTHRIVQGMNSKGSYNYNYDNSKLRCDLSVAGWNYQAMKAAFSAGSRVDGLEEAMDKAVSLGLKRTHFGGDGFCYGENEGKRSTMTSVGTLCLQLLGERGSREARAGLASLENSDNFWFDWKGKNGKVPGWSMYQWYYQTQAIFQGHDGKGLVWNKWNKAFIREMRMRQKSDGRWETPAFEASSKGGHGEQMFEGIDQPVYATALSCLMLTVYYRYLPSFDIAGSKGPRNSIIDEEDLGLRIEDI